MQADARLTGDAAALAREHGDVLGRLPATVHAFILVELQKWQTLFPPEQRYQRALLEHLSALAASALDTAAAGIARIERDAGITRLSRRDPARLQDDAQGLLRQKRLVSAWRQAIDAFFQQIDPALEARLSPPDAGRRLVVQIYGSGIAVQTKSLWSRMRGVGVRVPLKLDGAQTSEAFLRALFGSASGPSRLGLFSVASRSGFSPLDTWIVEAHEGLHDLCTGGMKTTDDPRPSAAGQEWAPWGVSGLSYDRLRPYRDKLMASLYDKILKGVESPQAFAAYARSLKIDPGPDTMLQVSERLQAFVRDVFLTGNGTLFVNNTFVEWAAVQAVRRAQPRLLVTRFGVRDKLKPFSSLLLFSQPRESDQIPMIEDPLGSFIDVEQLSYYVWLNAEKSPAYRNRTLYLFVSESLDEMLAVRSGVPAPAGLPASTLPDVYATMAEWLGLPRPDGAGRPIDQLVT